MRVCARVRSKRTVAFMYTRAIVNSYDETFLAFTMLPRGLHIGPQRDVKARSSRSPQWCCVAMPAAALRSRAAVAATERAMLSAQRGALPGGVELHRLGRHVFDMVRPARVLMDPPSWRPPSVRVSPRPLAYSRIHGAVLASTNPTVCAMPACACARL